MGFKCGIVGLPNVGKSTLFNALTKAGIEASNYPFCTIEPNVGIVNVPDPRLDKIASIANPKQTLATTIKFVDIAGLVKGASKGEGLGNKFLAHIREVDAIAKVVRCFSNPDVTHVSGTVNPIDDIEIINTELILSDLESIEKATIKKSKLAKSGDKDAKIEFDILERIKEHLNENKSARQFEASDEEQAILNKYFLLSAKPILYIANIDEANFTDNPFVKQVQEYADKEGAVVVAICAELEAELAELSDTEKNELLSAYDLTEPGLNRVIRAGYKLLNLETYFTAGPKEVRAWTVSKGTHAPQAAGVIHTDFERGFIRAEVIAYDDFVEYNGEHGAKEAGKLRIEGKDYIVNDGDIMHFRFNV